MSRHFSVLNKSESNHSHELPRAVPMPQTRYAELISELFRGITVAALVRSTSGEVAKGVCREVASELGQSGRRTLVVSVETLLKTGPVSPPDEADFIPGESPNLWHWPRSTGSSIDFFKTRTWTGEGNWLDSLRARFGWVVLDCPELDVAPGATAIAAMAGAAVLVVEAGRTPKHRILLDQRTLQSGGANLVGSILVNGK